MAKPKNWTPEEVKDKEAVKLQMQFYAGGVVSGIIAWLLLSNQSSGPGGLFALASVAAFLIGGLIKTTYRKKAQANIYVKDKKTESLRAKFLVCGIVCAIIAAIVFINDGSDAGALFTVASIGALLIVGLMPVKWIKRGELGGYRKER